MFNLFKKNNKQESIQVPNNPVDRNIQGKEFEKAGEIDKAIALYEKNVEEKFEGNAPYDRLAIIYRKRKQYQDEMRVLNSAISVFEREQKKNKRQDVIPKLKKFHERLEKVKALVEKN